MCEDKNNYPLTWNSFSNFFKKGVKFSLSFTNKWVEQKQSMHQRIYTFKAWLKSKIFSQIRAEMRDNWAYPFLSQSLPEETAKSSFLEPFSQKTLMMLTVGGGWPALIIGKRTATANVTEMRSFDTQPLISICLGDAW